MYNLKDWNKLYKLSPGQTFKMENIIYLMLSDRTIARMV